VAAAHVELCCGGLRLPAYSRDKLRYSLFNDAVATVWYLLVLLYGIMPFFWLIAGQLLETTLGIPAGSNEVGAKHIASTRGSVQPSFPQVIASCWSDGPQVAQSVVFVLLDGLFDKVRTIPLSYYYTFVVEATVRLRRISGRLHTTMACPDELCVACCA